MQSVSQIKTHIWFWSWLTLLLFICIFHISCFSWSFVDANKKNESIQLIIFSLPYNNSDVHILIVHFFTYLIIHGFDIYPKFPIILIIMFRYFGWYADVKNQSMTTTLCLRKYHTIGVKCIQSLCSLLLT